jgi:two-component system KDP operon response regulator KdpE
MPSAASVTIIATDARLRAVLRAGLEKEGYLARDSDAEGAGRFATSFEPPDVLLLHLDSSRLGAAELARQLQGWRGTFILALIPQNTATARAAVLDAGADDCVTWPCEFVEIFARLRALRRRAEKPKGEPHFKSGPLKIDFVARTVTLRGEELRFTPIEYALLRLLAVHRGNVVTQRQILREIWGTDAGAQSRHLRVHLSNVRRKLSEAGFDTRQLRNEPGVGYRWMAAGER